MRSITIHMLFQEYGNYSKKTLSKYLIIKYSKIKLLNKSHLFVVIGNNAVSIKKQTQMGFSFAATPSRKSFETQPTAVTLFSNHLRPMIHQMSHISSRRRGSFFFSWPA